MRPENFEVSLVDVGGVHIVRLNGELDIATADGLMERLVEVGRRHRSCGPR